MILSCTKTHRRRSNLPPAIICTLLLLSLVFTSGCSLMVSSAASGMMDNLSKTILDNDDLALVESGSPAYLLMIDSLIIQDPGNKKMLSTAASLYSAYSDIFVKDPDRSRKMADKAFNYARQAICISRDDACDLKERSYQEFEAIISKMNKQDVPLLFSLGNAWAGWIIANRSDFNAIADMARIELIMLKITNLDETYKDGAAYLYLGTMATFLPPALGGRPEQGKHYFEKALKLSQGKNLMVKVMYAKLYARMIFDKPLHDRLLDEVLTADPNVQGHTLINTYAQQQAKELRAGSEDYF